MREGRIPEAIPEYQQALAGRPGNPAIIGNLALAHFKLGQYGEVASLLEPLQPRYPESEQLALLLAACLTQRNESATVVTVLSPFQHYLYGMVLLHGDSAAALDQFRQELARDGKHVPSLLAIVRERERQSQFQKALPYAERAVAAEPGNYAAHAILGRVLVAMDRTQEGLTELETAKHIEPGSPQVYFALASAYAKAGRGEDAAKARAEFLRLKNLRAVSPRRR